MNKAQKIAWFNLAVVLAGTALSVLLAIIKAVKLMFVVFLGIGVLVGISPILFQKKGTHLDFDERDQVIRMRALLFATGSSFFYLIWTCAIQIIKVGSRGSVKVSTLVGLIGGALIFFVMMKSFWTLFEYRYGRK